MRYADDPVIPCRTEDGAPEALQRVGLILARLGLALHAEETRAVDVREGRQGFDFLGFHCRRVKSWRYRGRKYLQQWPSRQAMQAVRDRIKAVTAPRHRLPGSVQQIVDELNRLLRGWGAYFCVGNSSRQFRQVDDYVRERLGLFLSKKTGRSGRGWARYPVAFFERLGVQRLSGTVRWYTATPRAARSRASEGRVRDNCTHGLLRGDWERGQVSGRPSQQRACLDGAGSYRRRASLLLFSGSSDASR